MDIAEEADLKLEDLAPGASAGRVSASIRFRF
jgi:hypothetical protein